MNSENSDCSAQVSYFERLVLHNRTSRVFIGASVAMLCAQIMINLGGTATVDGLLTVASGMVIWAAGMTLTVRPIAEILDELKEELSR